MVLRFSLWFRSVVNSRITVKGSWNCDQWLSWLIGRQTISPERFYFSRETGANHALIPNTCSFKKTKKDNGIGAYCIVVCISVSSYLFHNSKQAYQLWDQRYHPQLIFRAMTAKLFRLHLVIRPAFAFMSCMQLWKIIPLINTSGSYLFIGLFIYWIFRAANSKSINFCGPTEQ